MALSETQPTVVTSGPKLVYPESDVGPAITNDTFSNWFRGIAAPDLSFTVNVTVGWRPAVPLSTFEISRTKPFNEGESSGTTCAPLIEASNSNSPCGMWQIPHWLSLTCGPPACFAPVAKFTSSWQEPQDTRVGLVR